MILERYEKQPAEVKDYDIDYSPWLATVADTLQSETHTVVCLSDPLDEALICNAVFITATKAKCWMAGGTPGMKYKLTVTVTTAGGRIDQSELIFKIKDY